MKFCSCYYYSALADLLLERAGYDHKIIRGKQYGEEHNWNSYKRPTDTQWVYMETVPYTNYGRKLGYGFTESFMKANTYRW